MACVPVGVDQAGNDHLAGAIDDLLSRMSGSQFFRRADLDDPVLFDRHGAVIDHASGRVHGHDRSVKQQESFHFIPSVSVRLSCAFCAQRPGPSCRCFKP